jgi:hypothetical protein
VSPLARLALFAAALAAVFGGGFALGNAVGDGGAPPPAHGHPAP